MKLTSELVIHGPEKPEISWTTKQVHIYQSKGTQDGWRVEGLAAYRSILCFDEKQAKYVALKEIRGATNGGHNLYCFANIVWHPFNSEGERKVQEVLTITWNDLLQFVLDDEKLDESSRLPEPITEQIKERI